MKFLMNVSIGCLFVIVGSAHGTVAAQQANAAPAATTGKASAAPQTPANDAPAAASVPQPQEAKGAPEPEGQGTREAPIDNNPYPMQPGNQPRRWSNADIARVRRMLEAERTRRAARGAQLGSEPHPAEPLALREEEQPVKHGNAGAPFAIGLAVDAVFHNDAGFRLFDQSKASSRLGVWVGYDLASLSPEVVLSGELGFGVEGQQGESVFNMHSVPMKLQSNTFHAALAARWNACSFFAPQLRASGGVSLFDLQLDVDAVSETDKAVSGFGALGAGFWLHTPARLLESRRGKFASLKFGVIVEAGYAVRSSVDFALRNHSSARSIPIVRADLGQFDLSGPYVRTSMVTRF
jgi:hypothetical protein